jgi:hypothetical protein
MQPLLSSIRMISPRIRLERKENGLFKVGIIYKTCGRMSNTIQKLFAPFAPLINEGILPTFHSLRDCVFRLIFYVADRGISIIDSVEMITFFTSGNRQSVAAPV